MRLDSGSVSPEEQELLDEIRELRRQAGQPPLREIAADTGNTSHSSIGALFKGDQLPSLRIFNAVVRALEGDHEHFRRLWERAWRAREAARTHVSDVRSSSGSPVTGVPMCYLVVDAREGGYASWHTDVIEARKNAVQRHGVLLGLPILEDYR